MLNETKQASGKEQLNGPAEHDVAIVEEEIEENELSAGNTFYERVNQVIHKFASTHVGQMIIEKADRVLQVLEDTAKWSLPQDDAENQLQRPLPWIFFLTLIVCLRIFRIWLSVAYYIVGSQPVTPISMVEYLQTKRSCLRAIKVQGDQTMRNQEIERTVVCSPNRNSKVMEKLGELLSSAICKPGQNRETPAVNIFSQDAKNVENLAERSSKRPRDDDDADIHNLTVSEMLDQYANEDSDDDSDYVPECDEDDDDEGSSTSHASTLSAEETELENTSIESQKDISTSQIKTKSEEQTKEERIKENGERQYQAKLQPLEPQKVEIHTAADSDNEQMHTPKEISDENGAVEAEESNEMPAATTTEVAPQSSMATPKTTLNHLAVLQESTKKSTPGHESAASQKPSLPTTATTTDSVRLNNSKENKSYRTITTQTAIELDWTITIKTEITHQQHPPKLETLNCSINLTPASSTEDIFYSPMGSMQDFHSIFHPAPLVNGITDEAPTMHTTSDTLEAMAAGTQRKNMNHSGHNKRYHYYNAKTLSKIRR